jgi:hypothetical protein
MRAVLAAMAPTVTQVMDGMPSITLVIMMVSSAAGSRANHVDPLRSGSVQAAN